MQRFSKIDKLRSLVKNNGYRPTTSSNLAQCVKQEVESIKKELHSAGLGDMTRDMFLEKFEGVPSLLQQALVAGERALASFRRLSMSRKRVLFLTYCK